MDLLRDTLALALLDGLLMRSQLAQLVLGALQGLLSELVARDVDQDALHEQLLASLVHHHLGLAKDAMATVRKVITDLRPSVLDQLGVWSALEWYTEQIGQRSGLQCVCSIDPALLALELDHERGTMLFRIVQEALTNVVRHAEASQVSVRVGRRDGGLLIRIHDNGKGIDAERLLNQESWGIRGMRERARHFHGEITVTGGAELGTTLSLELPLEHDDDNPDN